MSTSSQKPPFTTATVEQLLKNFHKPEEIPPEYLRDIQLIRPKLASNKVNDLVKFKRATNRLLESNLEQSNSSSFEQTELLYLRFIENGGTTNVAIAKKYGYSKQKAGREIKKGCESLAALLNSMESEAKSNHENRLKHTLGSPTYKSLMGPSDLWQRISTNIVEPNGKWISVVTGIGGIGKSSQTHRAIIDVIEKSAVDHLIFIDAKNTELKIKDFLKAAAEKLELPQDQYKDNAELSVQLVQIFRSKPYLILIDGIEEIVDQLIQELTIFADPTQIVITSRVKPEDKSHLHYYEVPQLDEDVAAKLIIEAKTALQFPEPSPIPKDKLQKIIEKIGGNPLALKIIGGLLVDYHIDEIIDDLLKVQFKDTEKLYRRIYLKAWDGLHPKVREVFASFAVIPGKHTFSKELLLSFNQGTVDSMRELVDVLHFLKTRSLIDIDRSIENSTTQYKIHNLTRSFLATDIIDWGS